MKFFYYSCIGTLIIGFSTAAAFFLFAPSYVQKKIVTGVSKSCDTCSIEIGNTYISLLSPRLWTFQNIRFKGGNPEISSYDVKIDEVAMEVSLRPLWNRKLHVNRLDITNPDVTLTEGEKTSRRSEKENSSKYKLENIRLSNGIFTYV